MAPLRSFMSVLLLLLVLVAVVEVTNSTMSTTYHPMGGEGSVQPAECPGKCAYRCSATSHKKPCMFFCIKCCKKCLCVPSGMYGHKEECPCYNNWKTEEGRPKCP